MKSENVFFPQVRGYMDSRTSGCLFFLHHLFTVGSLDDTSEFLLISQGVFVKPASLLLECSVLWQPRLVLYEHDTKCIPTMSLKLFPLYASHSFFFFFLTLRTCVVLTAVLQWNFGLRSVWVWNLFLLYLDLAVWLLQKVFLCSLKNFSLYLSIPSSACWCCRNALLWCAGPQQVHGTSSLCTSQLILLRIRERRKEKRDGRSTLSLWHPLPHFFQFNTHKKS